MVKYVIRASSRVTAGSDLVSEYEALAKKLDRLSPNDPSARSIEKRMNKLRAQATRAENAKMDGIDIGDHAGRADMGPGYSRYGY